MSELQKRARHHVEELEKFWLRRLKPEDISELVQSVLTDFSGIDSSFLKYVDHYKHAIRFEDLDAICKKMTPFDKFLVRIISETESKF